MSPEISIVNDTFLLQKFPGKGGWTYAQLRGIAPHTNNPFGWVRVRGWIDTNEIKGYHLMPMGNGHLFLPVKAGIRRIIGKQAGDYIQVVLYADEVPTDLPEELKLCRQDEPDAYAIFLKYTDAEQKARIEWIYSAKTEDTRVERIATLVKELASTTMTK